MKIGDTWREWTIEGILGQGAFGEVYKVVRHEMGHSYYAALKVIQIPSNRGEYDELKGQGMTDHDINTYYQSVATDFSNELKMMDELKGHTNIVSYESHVIERRPNGVGWTIYICMELLTPLYQYADQHPLSERDIIKLGVDLCTALEVCRKNNTIHRDIKPANIFVSKFGDYKLGDFGIARQLEQTEGALSKKGTYTYMAPEVYLNQPYNHTVDIYSLGIVLYVMLNNRRAPFFPPAPQPIHYSASNDALIRRMNGEPFPLPCNASNALASVVLKACAFRPQDRFQTPTEMKNALLSLNAQIGFSEQATTVLHPGDAAQHHVPQPPTPQPTPIPQPTPMPPLPQKKKSNKKAIIIALSASLAVIIAVVAVTAILMIPKDPVIIPDNDHTVAPLTSQVTETVEIPTEAAAIPGSFISTSTGAGAAEADWTDLIQVASGSVVHVGLKSDGTVVADGYDDDGRCSVESWRDITAISCVFNHTVGLKSDGTVVATGKNDDGRCDVDSWSDIVKIAAGYDHTVGLKSNGTVVATGTNDKGQCDVEAWRDIVAISAGDRFTVGVKSDGTVVSTGSNSIEQCKVDGWKDIVDVSCGGWHTIGLKKDGTVVATGKTEDNRCDVGDWTDITAIAAGYEHSVGLKSDGTVVACGSLSSKSINVDDWKNIICIDGGFSDTVGIQE